MLRGYQSGTPYRIYCFVWPTLTNVAFNNSNDWFENFHEALHLRYDTPKLWNTVPNPA